VALDTAGARMVKASPDGRKGIWREQILKLGLFQRIHTAIERSEPRWVTRELVLETIVLAMPSEDYEKVFATLIGWARFGDLFAYDEATERVSLQE